MGVPGHDDLDYAGERGGVKIYANVAIYACSLIQFNVSFEFPNKFFNSIKILMYITESVSIDLYFLCILKMTRNVKRAYSILSIKLHFL